MLLSTFYVKKLLLLVLYLFQPLLAGSFLQLLSFLNKAKPGLFVYFSSFHMTNISEI